MSSLKNPYRPRRCRRRQPEQTSVFSAFSRPRAATVQEKACQGISLRRAEAGSRAGARPGPRKVPGLRPDRLEWISQHDWFEADRREDAERARGERGGVVGAFRKR